MDINDAVQHLLFVMILACVTIVRAVNCDDHQCPVACQCSDNNSLITCRNKNLTEVPYNISGPVETIDLSENLVDSIPFASFRNLPNLAVLLMNHNRIARIDDNAFASLTGLEILDLSDNFLDVLSSTTFRDLTSLQVLHLSGNCFPSIPDLQYPRSLKELSVGGDTVEAFKLPSSFHELSLLKKLVLHVGVNVQTINSDDFKWLTSDIEQIVIVGGTNVDIDPDGGGAHCLYSHLQYFSWLTGNASSTGHIVDHSYHSVAVSRFSAMTVNGFNNVSVSSENTFGIIENLNVETLYVAFIDTLIDEDASDFASMLRLLALGLYMRTH
jgi:hypothetical protein